MSKGYFSGFAWHVEKAKGTNTTWKKCKNCIFFENDDNSCIKKLIPITNNNAKYCKDYVNIHDENTSSYLAEIKNERKNLIGKKALKEHIETKKVKSINYNLVELNDKVEVFSEGTVKKYLIPSDLTNIPIIPRNCLGKKVGDEFWINDKKYKILSIKKSITV